MSLSFGIMLIRPDDLQEVDRGWIVSVPAEDTTSVPTCVVLPEMGL